MINNSDLRLGNWIKHKDYHLKVNDINHYMVCCEPHWGFDMVEDIEGIPLTPEILEKFGSPCDQHSQWQFSVKISAISIYFRANAGIWYSELAGIYLGDKIQYVHQLQNLFFILTGKELELTF